MTKSTIALKIDVTKIDKQRLYQGKKGKYLDAVLFFNDEPDQYDQNGMICESISKEERESGQQGTILGNAKLLGQQKPKKAQTPEEEQPSDDDLPF